MVQCLGLRAPTAWGTGFFPGRGTNGEGSGTPLQYSCLENPWTEEPGRLQSMGSLRVGYDWATSLSLFTFMHWRRKWQPTPVFLPGESQGRGAWRAAVYGVAQSRTRLKGLSSSSSRGTKILHALWVWPKRSRNFLFFSNLVENI